MMYYGHVRTVSVIHRKIEIIDSPPSRKSTMKIIYLEVAESNER